MVMTGGEGTDLFGDYVDRNTFCEITPEHWRTGAGARTAAMTAGEPGGRASGTSR